MENTIIKEVSKKGIDTYLKFRQYQAMFWATFFPLKNVITLDYTTLIGEQGGRVAADVIAYDASAPLKTRQVVSKLYGSIPKVAIKKVMSEKEILEYRILSGMSDANEQQILDLVYDDVSFVVDGVNARMEWLALRALSTTAIALSSSNNNGIVTEENIDFQMPAANKKFSSVVWSASAATTKPITDIKAVVKAARAKGTTLSYMLMHPDIFDYFVLSTETQTFLKSYFNLNAESVNILESVEAINRVMTANRLPSIIIMDQSLTIEASSGVRTDANPWESKYILFVPDLNMGNMLNGPIAEEIAPPKQVIQSKASNVLVSKYSTVDPVNEFTKGEANVFPSWKNVDRCYSFNSASASQWA